MADRLVTKSNVSVTFVWVKTTVDRDVWVIQFRDGAGAVQHTSAKADSLDDAKEFHSRSAKKKGRSHRPDAVGTVLESVVKKCTCS